MEITKEPETIEVAANEPAPEAKSAPTRDELKSQGWSAKELESAEKRGMITKPEEKKPEPKAEEKKVEAKPEAKPEAKAMPDYALEMTPEQEAEFKRIFGAGSNVSGLYFRQKMERQAKQANAAKIKELEAKLQALEAAKPAPRVEVDAEGREIDPEDKPLTLKELRAMQKAEADAYAARERENGERAQTVAEAQTSQEEYAKTVHADFDATVELAKDVIKNFETMFPEKWKQTKVIKLIRDLQGAAANADKIGIDEYTAAIIGYELGQFHPQYGKTPEKGEETGKEKIPKDPKASGGLTTEQMKRIEANTQRRASSASVADGGGKRTVSVEDVDIATLNKMNLAERTRFREKHPDRYAKLLRG